MKFIAEWCVSKEQVKQKFLKFGSKPEPEDTLKRFLWHISKLLTSSDGERADVLSKMAAAIGDDSEQYLDVLCDYNPIQSAIMEFPSEIDVPEDVMSGIYAALGSVTEYRYSENDVENAVAAWASHKYKYSCKLKKYPE